MTVVYIDCQAGVSGDMLLAALMDAGASLDGLNEVLAHLPEPHPEIEAERVLRGGIAALHVRVQHADRSAQGSGSFQELLRLVDGLPLSGRAREKVQAVLHRLGEAEARVHHVPLEELHLHELGSMDTVVDVVGVVVALEQLGIEQVYAAPLPAGRGVVASEHGPLPVPAPAVLELATMAHAPLRPPAPGEAAGELVTPTGAALLTTLASFERPTIYLDRVGYGAGTRDPQDRPNVVAVWLGETASSSEEREAGQGLVLIETNIDDMTPEVYGYVRELLFQEGARDVWFTPIQMKKDRPGVMVSVLTSAVSEGRMLALLFRETSTLGARVREVRRPEVDREVVTVETPLGPAGVKLKKMGGRVVAVAPEYEDCRRLAQKTGLPLQEVYRLVSRSAEDRWLDR